MTNCPLPEFRDAILVSTLNQVMNYCIVMVFQFVQYFLLDLVITFHWFACHTYISVKFGKTNF